MELQGGTAGMATRGRSSAYAEFRGLLDALICTDGPAPIASAVVRLESAGGQVLFEGAAGVARPDTCAAMSPLTPFHVASVAKAFTAAVVLQLAEEGRFGRSGLDTRYADFAVFQNEVMQRLHRREGVSLANRITLRHLLTHTSGIRDAMVDDAEHCGGPAPGSIIGELLVPGGNPARAWVPWNPGRADDPYAGVINFFLNRGIADHPIYEPGEGFHYSDTGFVLLGLLVEAIEGRPLHQSLRKRIMQPLGLERTYLAYRDDPPLGPNRAPESEVLAGVVPVLTSGTSLSFDWAGGGIVTDVAELSVFLRALATGRLFRSAGTWEQMTAWVCPPGLDGSRTGVGLGLFRTACDGAELWGHSGAWGTKMAVEPRSGTLFTGTTNQARSPGDWHHPFIRCALRQLE
jgi:D-alanyl-D-alanine carboxypeptidase